MSKSTMIGRAEISRRSLLQVGVAAAGAVPVLAMTAKPAMAKLTQTSVVYQKSPKGEESCANCNLFQPPSACRFVDGTVAPAGWCKIWAKKAG